MPTFTNLCTDIHVLQAAQQALAYFLRYWPLTILSVGKSVSAIRV